MGKARAWAPDVSGARSGRGWGVRSPKSLSALAQLTLMLFLLGQILGNNPGKASRVLPCSGQLRDRWGWREKEEGTRPLKT